MTTLEKIKLEITSHFLWDGEVKTDIPYTVQVCLEIIDKYAEQEPKQKIGRWIKTKDGYMRCDQCGSRGSAIKARYCHHCGAEMKGGIRAGNYEKGYEKYPHINSMDDCIDAVEYADTIIEADKESEDKE